MEYGKVFADAIAGLKAEGRYRTFADLERHCGSFPRASGTLQTGRSRSLCGARTTTLAWANIPWSSRRWRRRSSDAARGRAARGTFPARTITTCSWSASSPTFHRKEAALLFTSGYNANEAAISTIAKLLPNCVIFSDQFNHASMIEGIRHSGVEKHIFKHNDAKDLERLLYVVAPDRPRLICLSRSTRWKVPSPRSTRSAM